MSLYLFKHTMWQCGPFQLVNQLIEVVEENGLLRKGDGLNGAARALTDNDAMSIQCLW